MLENDPQIEGSFQLHYTGGRGRPVVCKESTAHHHHGGPAKHSTHCTLHSTAQSPTPVVIFFFALTLAVCQ